MQQDFNCWGIPGLRGIQTKSSSIQVGDNIREYPHPQPPRAARVRLLESASSQNLPPASLSSDVAAQKKTVGDEIWYGGGKSARPLVSSSASQQLASEPPSLPPTLPAFKARTKSFASRGLHLRRGI